MICIDSGARDRYVRTVEVSAAGVLYGEINGSNPKLVEFVVASKIVDFRPLDVNIRGDILAAPPEYERYDTEYWSERFVETSNGLSCDIPEGSYIERIDDQGRLHGYLEPEHISSREPYVWSAALDALGDEIVPRQWIRGNYEMPQLPDGWGAPLKIAPNEDQASIGTATSSAEARDFFTFPIQLQPSIDNDKNGFISFSPADKTTPEPPFYLLLNNDYDTTDGGILSIPNHEDTIINGAADLLDFTRLQIKIPSIVLRLKDGTLELRMILQNQDPSPTELPGANLWALPEIEEANWSESFRSDVTLAEQLVAQSTSRSPWVLQSSNEYAIPLQYWQDFDDDAEDLYSFIEATSVGKAQLITRLYHEDRLAAETEPLFLQLLKVDVVPDYKRDGKIDLKDRNKITDTNPHRWWLNDDDDISEVKGKDAPGDGSADYNNSAVDTARDLVDFFPVFIDLKSFLTGINDLSTITVKLKHADGSLKFVYTDLLPEDSREYWYETGLTTGYGSSFTSAPGVADTVAITSSGVALSQAFLTKIKDDDKGVIMLEGAGSSSSTEPLVLEVSNSSGALFEFEMPLELSPVTDMFRNVNLASRVGTSEGDYPDSISEPSNYPDTFTNNKHFAFIHGYNVSQDQSKGWNCELFKRMHQMGSRAKFVGVTWDGDTSPDYHNAVYRAFRTSEHVAAELGGFSNLTIAAHSLGNMVISNAISKHGFLPDNYYLMNAATPIEAYTAAQASNSSGNVDMDEYMTEADWKDYPDRLYASNWYQLFDSNDKRSELTWKDRFSVVKNFGYNFYSPGEDIVENASPDETFFSGALTTIGSWWDSDDNGRHAWVLQEIGKGNTALRAAKLIGQVEEVQAGWDFNGNQNDLEQVGVLKGIPVDSDSYRPRFASETSATVPTNEQLAQFGFFSRFNEYNDEKLYAPIDDANVLPRVTQTQAGASALAAQDDNRWHLLAEAIPAMSFAAAANHVNGMQENYNMMNEANGWPLSRLNDSRFGSDWLHSDFKNVSLNYTRKKYEKIISIGGLDDE
ncbi:MAG: hypothetical protein ACI9JZ_002048 [Lentimonas sp.]